ncbi:DUF742 domain-containing protein [Saccharomonospora sp. NPDC046836]|uniref:DUF742 domain-containing protein n=1 Tax=Saccharomonospora sp. NPDC046836 TaxID=3156921 RepID=UPI0034054F3D
MDSGHLRGDGWLGRGNAAGRWPAEPDADRAYPARDDRDFTSSQPGQADDSGEWLAPSDGGGQGPAEFDVTEYRQRLMGGPGAELYGMGGGGMIEPGDDSAAFSAFAERSLDGGPASQSFPSAPVPRQVSAESETPMESSGLVRPYFRTKGRTRPDYDLAIEALVSTSEQGRRLERVRVPEHRSICGICLDTRSVAEVAALLRLPLGVVRVLVGDVAGLGLVLVHSSTSMVGDRPSIEFMERVLSGLRRI